MRHASSIAVRAALCLAGLPAVLEAQSTPPAYFEFQVTKPVRPAPGSKSPVYPEILKTAGVSGEVLVQFIVDTLGAPDTMSFKVLRSSHELFTRAVRAALPGMAFVPAELNGQKVRQLVQEPFVFGLKNPDGTARIVSGAQRPAARYPANLPLTPAPHGGKIDGWVLARRSTVDSGNGKPPTVIVSKFSGAGSRLRMEITSSLFPANEGAYTLIDSTDHTISIVSAARTLVSINSLPSRSGEVLKVEPFARATTVRDLGPSELIAGAPTRHYQVTGVRGSRVTFGDRSCVLEGESSADVWTTTDPAMTEGIRRAIAMTGALASSAVMDYYPASTNGPPGVALRSVSKRTVTTADGGRLTVVTSSEVTQFVAGPIDASLFDPPEGYQRFDMRGRPAAISLDSLNRSVRERTFLRLVDSVPALEGLTRQCTTVKKP